MSGNESNRKSLVMFLTSMLIFATIGIFRKYIPLPSEFIALFRGIIGGSLIWVFMILRKKAPDEKLPIKTTLWFAVTGAVMGINWIFLFESYNATTVSMATLCYYMEPTIVILLSPLFFKEKLTAKKTVCALIAIIGLSLVSGISGKGSVTSGDFTGIVLGLSAAVCYSIVVIMNKKTNGVNAYQKTAIQLLSAGVVMIPYLLVTGNWSFSSLSGMTAILLLVVCLVHTGIAYLLYFGSMDGLKAQSIAIFSYVDPVAALVFSAVFLNETMSIFGIIGAIMIIGSALISEIELQPGEN